MGPETIVTLLGVAVIVVALALYLITITYTLNHVSFTVGTVLIGVRAIAQQCEPLAPVIRDMVREVQSIDQDLEALVGGGQSRERQPSHALPYGTRMYGPPQKGF